MNNVDNSTSKKKRNCTRTVSESQTVIQQGLTDLKLKALERKATMNGLASVSMMVLKLTVKPLKMQKGQRVTHRICPQEDGFARRLRLTQLDTR